MQTGLRCPTCDLPVLTNHIIVGLPVLRITGLQQSAVTGQEIVFHVACFIEKMRGQKKPELLKP